MMNEAHISLTGYVASEPRIKTIREGLQNVSMRVAWTPRWLDRATGEWADGNTSYVTVTCWRKLAENAAVCLRKGDPVVIKGRLSVRSYDDKQGVPRTQVDVDANSIGHDLCRGVALFQRTRSATGKTAAEYAAELAAGGGSFDVPGGGDEDAVLAAVGEPAPGGDGSADRDMFDADAIASLAKDAAGSAAPF